MKIDKIIGFLSPVAKSRDGISLEEIFGQDITSDTRLFELLSEIFNKAEKECDIQIRFIAQTQDQDNDVREGIINLTNNFDIDNCRPMVRSLSYLTDNKTKEGLLFFVKAVKDDNSRTFIARFPAEVGITITQANGQKHFDVTEDIFLKNSRRYKAVYYDSKDQYWVGYAVDKQVNDSNGKIKEISEYWIKDFLKSELKMNSKRGSRLLAKAIRKTITESDNETIKSELIGITSTIKNMNNRKGSIKTLLGILNLSDDTKSLVMKQIENPSLNNISFNFDIEEFEHNFNYLVNILDNGAIVIGPAKDFGDIWDKEKVAEGVYKYSTEGHPIKEKISNSRL